MLFRSIVFHNLTKVSLISQMQKDEYLHWYGNWEFESEMIDKIKNKIWVGLYHFPYKTDNLYHIPNYYEFTQNKELSQSRKIGFAARAEGRKNLEYIDGLESVIFTNSDTFNKYYRKKYGYGFGKSKVYKFDYKYKERFYGLDWGISHSCFEFEPFGYGIFEAVDWGKLPILHEKWHVPLDYKYKAFDKISFDETYKTLCEDDYETRKREFEKLNGPSLTEIIDTLKQTYNLKESHNKLFEKYGVTAFSKHESFISKVREHYEDSQIQKRLQSTMMYTEEEEPEESIVRQSKTRQLKQCLFRYIKSIALTFKSEVVLNISLNS